MTCSMPDNLPDLLRAYRARHGLSQDGLSARWDVPAMTIRGWEQGKRPSQPSMIIALIREILVDRDSSI